MLAMEFFDLNIPYNESISSSSTSNLKTTRIKIATKAMELGYSGIAYNRTIKGVMSDHDRCSISLLPLSSLLKSAPFLSSAVNFHRHMLHVTRSSPFRQYTRITVCTDSIAQAQVLNSGNSVIKTYDLVAVRPLNQKTFDYACEKSEVDIISIDLSDKLPFRLKFPMIKAAIERGVYFEIIYSDLIGDVQVRRQMIANAKLLVDWSRGRNLILASAASSVNELRGPYDVANLLSLIALPMERAKSASSKNCRTLITNASRKKHFYKEAVRVEVIPSFGSKESSSVDLLKWDPLCSGDGDLLLDDVAKSFSAATAEVSKSVKAINFASIIDTSHGFQVKDLLFAPKASSQSLNNGKIILSAEISETSVRTASVSKPGIKLEISPQATNSSCHISSCENSSKLYLSSEKTYVSAVETATPMDVPEEEAMNISKPEVSFKMIESEMQDMILQKCISTELDADFANTNVQSDLLDMELDAASNDVTVPEENRTFYTNTEKELKKANNLDEYPSSKGAIPTFSQNINVSNSLNEESKIMESDVILVEQNDVVNDVTVEEVDNKDLVNASGGENIGESIFVPKGSPSVQNHEPVIEVSMEYTKDGESDSNVDLPTSVQCVSGKSRAKGRKPRHIFLSPSKRLLMKPITFKKAHKFKRRTKTV